MAEALAPLVLLPGHRHGAKADAAAPAVQPVSQGDLHGVQGLLPQAVGPPQPGIGNFNYRLGSLGGEDGAVGARHLHGHRGGAGDFRNVGGYRQGHLALAVGLLHQHVPDPGGVDAQKGDVPPDARIRQAGAPVPAEHAVGLAQQGEAHHGIGGAVGSGLGVGFLDKAGGGVEFHGDVVLPRLQCGLYVELPDPVHVLCLAHLHAVDGDGGQGVQSVAVEQHLLAAQQLVGNLEIPAVDKVIVRDFQGLVLVVPVEGVRNLACGEQVVIHGAGDGGMDAGEGAARDVQHPGAVQGKFFHVNTSEYDFERVAKFTRPL